jgi:PD-(D/E)XK nuclease superfamily
VNALSTSGADVTEDLVTRILPLLGRSLKASFNVFDVMQHGSHEKQISNVFGWLLDPEATHELGDLFQRIFLDDLNDGRDEQDRFNGPYVVRQEVNTSPWGELSDISDLVLEKRPGTDRCRELLHLGWTRTQLRGLPGVRQERWPAWAGRLAVSGPGQLSTDRGVGDGASRDLRRRRQEASSKARW